MPLFDLATVRYTSHAKKRWHERIGRGQDPAMLRALKGAGPLPAKYRKALAARAARKRGCGKSHGYVNAVSYYSAEYDAILLLRGSPAGYVVVTVLCGTEVLEGGEK